MYEYPTQHTGQTDTVTVSDESRMCESWTRLNNPLILFVCQSASQPAAKLTSEHKNPDAFQSSITNRVNCSLFPFRFQRLIDPWVTDWNVICHSFTYCLQSISPAIPLSRTTFVESLLSHLEIGKCWIIVWNWSLKCKANTTTTILFVLNFSCCVSSWSWTQNLIYLFFFFNFIVCFFICLKGNQPMPFLWSNN